MNMEDTENTVIEILTGYGVTSDPRGEPINAVFKAVGRAMNWHSTAEATNYVNGLIDRKRVQCASVVAKGGPSDAKYRWERL